MTKRITFVPGGAIEGMIERLVTVGYNKTEIIKEGVRLLHRKHFPKYMDRPELTKPAHEVMVDKLYALEKMTDGEITELLVKIGFLEPKQPVDKNFPEGNFMINRIGRIELNDMRCTEWVYYTPEGQKYSTSQAMLWPEVVNKLKRFKPFLEVKLN